MKLLNCLIPLVLAASGLATDRSAFANDPKVLQKILQALENDGNEEITSHHIKDGDSDYSYHLWQARYFGTLTINGVTLHIAGASFVRSTPKGEPDRGAARGHNFFVFVTPDGEVKDHWRYDWILGDVGLSGTTLKDGDRKITDFASQTRGEMESGILTDSGSHKSPFSK